MTSPFVQRSEIRPAFAPGGFRRAVAALLLVTTSPLMAGCYSVRTLETAPAPGTTVLLDLSDRGRVAFADRIGASADRIQGELVSATDSGYVVRIQSVRYLNGQENEWTGEQIAVPTGLVARTRQRVFSRTRTLALVAGITAGVIIAALKTSLIGRGTGAQPEPHNPGGTGGT